MPRKESYQLPDGTATGNQQAYCEAWRALARPIEELTGCFLFRFDPDCGFCVKSGPRLDLPTWFIKLVNAALAERDELRAILAKAEFATKGS